MQKWDTNKSGFGFVRSPYERQNLLKFLMIEFVDSGVDTELFTTAAIPHCWKFSNSENYRLISCRETQFPVLHLPIKCGSTILSLLTSLHSLLLRIRVSWSCLILLDIGLQCVSVCMFVFYLPLEAPGELVPEIWVSFVSLKVFLLFLRLTINKHSQI